MDINWHGNTCFTIKGKSTTIVLNPDKDAGKLKGDVVLSSLKETAEVEGARKVFDWPGEYEMGGVPIVGFGAWTKSRSKEENEGEAGDPTILFYFEIDDVKICHFGELGHVLTSEMVSEIGDVDVLLIKAGSGSPLEAKKAVDVIEQIDPRVLIPMGEGDLQAVLKELGVSGVEETEKFTIKTASDLPDDKRTHVILKKS